MGIKVKIESTSKVNAQMQNLAEEMVAGMYSKGAKANVKGKFEDAFAQHLFGLTTPGIEALKRSALDLAFARNLLSDIEEEIDGYAEENDVSTVVAKDTVLAKFGVLDGKRYTRLMKMLMS